MENMLRYFLKCLDAKYINTENNGDYAIEREGDTLFLLFQWSRGKEDWKTNFNFPVKPYSDMGVKWKCHRGFLKVWKSIKPFLVEAVHDSTIKNVVVVGYSHGAAIATLAHEYVWFERPDLRDNLVGYGFGCPRCYWGIMKKELKQRWANFHPVRNMDDIVTHLPPVLFGFRHVNKVIKLGKRGQYKIQWKEKNLSKALPFTFAHYADEYIKHLRG